MAGIIIKIGSLGLAIIPRKRIVKKNPELIREIKRVDPCCRIYNYFGKKVIFGGKGENINITV